MYIGHVKYTKFLSQSKENLSFPDTFFEKYSNIKFNENPSCGTQTAACERTDGHDEAY